MSLFIIKNNSTLSSSSSSISTILPEIFRNQTLMEKLINIVTINHQDDDDNDLIYSTNPYVVSSMLPQKHYDNIKQQIDNHHQHQQQQQQQQHRHIDRLVEMTYTFRTIMFIIYMLTAIIAFIVNILAVLILNYGRRRTSRQLNLFLSNLGLSDIIFAIFNIPFTYITLIYNTWWLPEFLCPLTSFVQVLAPTVAFYTLIAIGIGRYYVIVTGQESLFLTKSSHTKLVIAIIWLISILIASPILLATKISPVIYLNETYVECIEDWSFINITTTTTTTTTLTTIDDDNNQSIGTIYTIIVFIMTFILPVVALTYLYGHIGLIVYKHSLPQGNDDRITNQNLTQTKVKVLKMLLLLVISFIVCWSPCQIFYLMLWIFEDIRQDPNAIDNNDINMTNIQQHSSSSYYSIIYYSIYFISHWLACSHTIMNPFIYCFCSNNFRIKDLMDIFCCINYRQDSWMNRSTCSNNNNQNNHNQNHNNNNNSITDNNNNNNDDNVRKIIKFKTKKSSTIINGQQRQQHKNKKKWLIHNNHQQQNNNNNNVNDFITYQV